MRKLLCATACTVELIIVHVLTTILATVLSCDVEGELRLDFAQGGQPLDQTEYYLIQVCILGEWSYVCHWNFDHQGVDNDVVLQQLQCSSGSKKLAETHLIYIIAFIIIIAATKYRSDVSNFKPAYLTGVACVGVEKRLIDCPRHAPLNYWGCPNKVQVNCSKSGIFKTSSLSLLLVCSNKVQVNCSKLKWYI